VVRHESKAASQGSTATPPPPPPPPSSSGGGGGFFWKLIGLTIVGGGGVVGYAYFDPKFRKTFEDYVPYSKEALGYILPAPAPEPPKKTPLPKKQEIIAPKKTEPIKDAQAKQTSTPATSAATSTTAAAAATAGSAAAAVASKAEEKKNAKQEAEEKKRLEKERAERALREQEQKEASENRELEFMLDKLTEDSQRAVTQALEALKGASQAVRAHNKQVKEAMESASSDAEWETAANSHQARTDAVSASDSAVKQAKTNMDKLKTTITDGKNSKTTKKNKNLVTSESELNKLNSSLSAAAAELSKAQSEAKVMAEYRDLVKKGREQFKKELESIMPDVKLGEKKGKLTEEELNSLIAHAHRRIEQLQRAVASHQTLEQLHINNALERQKEEDDKHATEQVEREKERWRAEQDVVKQNWDAEARVEFEKELRGQLARQAAAHSDHIVEVLRVQQRELEARNELKTVERLEEQRETFQRQVITWVARLNGIETAVEARAELEKRGRHAQELWLACQTLHTAVTLGKDGDTWEERLKPLDAELLKVRDAGDGNPYVTAILAAVPEAASHRGVWTEPALIERFSKVAVIGRRVAMIDESGGSLFRYLISYLQSAFVVRAARPLGRGDSVTPGEMDTFTILDSATACLERGDLEQAVRFINQLKGESRKVARDWLTEARLLLETRQAADALLAFATSTGLASLF